MSESLTASRYRVQFTPVGWHVVDTQEARDPIAEFGLGTEEYWRACLERDRLNREESP